MARLTYLLRIALVGAGLVALTAVGARAQPAVSPATTIRVIEVVDPGSGASARHVTEDLTTHEIARVQRALAAAGFYFGRATGRLDGSTRLALGRFQASRGLGRCDCVSYETVVALGIRPVVVAVIRAPLAGGYGSDVVVVVPRRHGVGVGHRSAVVVGHGPSVFVGHDPARGAGQSPKRGHVRDPRPPRPRPSGGSVSGAGAPIRVLTPPADPHSRTTFPDARAATP